MNFMFTGLQSIFHNFPEIIIKFPQYLVIVQAFLNIKKKYFTRFH